jgi:hypothetical protein
VSDCNVMGSQFPGSHAIHLRCRHATELVSAGIGWSKDPRAINGVACDKRVVDYQRRTFGELEHRRSNHVYVLRQYQEDSNILTVSDLLP